MDLLDVWLNIRKPTLEDKTIGDSIDAVEELLQKHDDFEKMVFAQEDRFNSIRRYTLVSIKLQIYANICRYMQISVDLKLLFITYTFLWLYFC